MDDIVITSVEVKDPQLIPLTENQIENGIEVIFDFEKFIEKE